jgi:hypothetical protein
MKGLDVMNRWLVLLILIVLGLSLGTAAKAQGPKTEQPMCWYPPEGKKIACYQINLIWSAGNSGPVEAPIQQEWKNLGIWNQCQTPSYGNAGGKHRITAMQLAVEAAKNKQDDRAFQIARSTQLHNPNALKTIDDAGVTAVADWLRTR